MTQSVKIDIYRTNNNKSLVSIVYNSVHLSIWVKNLQIGQLNEKINNHTKIEILETKDLPHQKYMIVFQWNRVDHQFIFTNTLPEIKIIEEKRTGETINDN